MKACKYCGQNSPDKICRECLRFTEVTKKEEAAETRKVRLFACAGYLPFLFPVSMAARPKSRFVISHAVNGMWLTSYGAAGAAAETLIVFLCGKIFNFTYNAGATFEYRSAGPVGYAVAVAAGAVIFGYYIFYLIRSVSDARRGRQTAPPFPVTLILKKRN